MSRSLLFTYNFFITFASAYSCRDGGTVDTRDLKSLDQEWLCGFESRSRHINKAIDL